MKAVYGQESGEGVRAVIQSRSRVDAASPSVHDDGTFGWRLTMQLTFKLFIREFKYEGTPHIGAQQKNIY